MYEIRKTARAETDLEDIWFHSFTEWDEAQADSYYDELSGGINKLAQHPKLGKPCDDVRPHYRVLPINRHLVYYKIEGDIIRVMRVLHDRMKPGRHL